MKLTVLFDADCALCWRARRWMSNQATYVELEFVAAGSARAQELYPSLDDKETRQLLHVVADDGRVWVGARAWLVCLWAVRRTRALAMSLRTPARIALAQRFVQGVSRNRYALSRLLGWEAPLRNVRPVTPVGSGCDDGSCDV